MTLNWLRDCRCLPRTSPLARQGIRIILLFLLAGIGPVLTACVSDDPKGDAGGRIDIYRTSDMDRTSNRAHAPSLWEFSDLVAEALVAEAMGD